MQRRQQRLVHLHRLWFNHEASEEELKEFFQILEESASEEEWHPLIRDVFENIQDNGMFGEAKKQQLAKYILSNYPVHSEDESHPFKNRSLTHRVHFLKTAWFRYAAAILLVVTGIALYYTLSNTSQPNTAIVQTVPPAVPNDAMPGYNRAVLTLSDGNKVEARQCCLSNYPGRNLIY